MYLLKRAKWAGVEEIAKLNQIEICPKAMDLTQTIVERISSDGGGALIIDYGSDGVVSDSLQVYHISLLIVKSYNFLGSSFYRVLSPKLSIFYLVLYCTTTGI